MKKAILLLFAFAFCCVYGMKTVQTSIPHGAEVIELHGILVFNAGPNDIEAYVYGSSVYVVFHRSFGNVSVTLYDPSGLVIYSDVVDTTVQQMVIIPSITFADGIYTIVLENASGYADGDFEVIEQP